MAVQNITGLLRALVDADACNNDRNDNCQAHSCDPRPCPHSIGQGLVGQTIVIMAIDEPLTPEELEALRSLARYWLDHSARCDRMENKAMALTTLAKEPNS